MTDASVQSAPGVPAAAVAAQADPVAATQGTWTQLPFGSEVLAVHAALLPTGKVLFAAGSGNCPTRFNDPGFGNTAVRNWTVGVGDPPISPPAGIPVATGGVDTGQDPQFFHPATTRDGQGNVLDLFCGGEAPLGDGRGLATGGSSGDH